jgi:polysaccharide export outer membrane protein
MTVEQLETRIEELYDARYLRSPDVAVNVVDYASHVVTVEGSVQKAGLFNFRPGTRLSGGIALAEGPTRVANVREVAIFRQSGNGTLIAKFDYAQVRAGSMMDPVLQPGDRIVVGTDNLSQTWQDFLRALPAFGMFTQF